MMDRIEIYLAYLAAFTLAGIVTILSSPMAIRLAVHFGILDKPDKRKVHAKAIPRMGGIAVFSGIIISFLVLSFFSQTVRDLILPHFRQFTFLIAGATLMFLLGLVDDVRGVSPRTKLVFQILAGVLAFYGGYQFMLARGAATGIRATDFWTLFGILLTVFWTVGTTNAVNLIDGLDGLASGITGIALSCLGLISIINNHLPTALAAFTIAGAAFGFLWHNRHPAKIFLGDSGSLLLGFLLAVLSIEGSQQGSLFASLVGPLCLLYIPILDTVLAMIRRSQKGLPFSFADNHHIHHRLLRNGIHHPHVVLILWSVTLGVGCIGLTIQFIENVYHSLIVNSFAIIVLALTVRYLGNLELFDYLRFASKINRRKRTPRGKIVSLRRRLLELEKCSTAEALLRNLGNLAESMELDSLTLSMSPRSRSEEQLSIYRWEYSKVSQSEAKAWNEKIPVYATVQASALYKVQMDSTITVELGRQSWKLRRHSEDVQLWANLIVEKLAEIKTLRIFCPGESPMNLSLAPNS
jgi:UDP-GlcNAc:undecaprenyl-phosphate/decaprenyl-phosphate GlcNAc-1-phosphate transferase